MDGIWSIDKGSIDSVTKTQPNEPSRFSGGVSFIQHRAYIAGRLKRCNPKLSSNKNVSNLVLSMFQDHVVDENFEIFRLGRVLVRQEASLVAKSRKNCKTTHLFQNKIRKLGRNRSNFGVWSSRPDQKDPQDRRGYFRKI